MNVGVQCPKCEYFLIKKNAISKCEHGLVNLLQHAFRKVVIVLYSEGWSYFNGFPIQKNTTKKNSLSKFYGWALKSIPM